MYRFGIMGCGMISHDFALGIRHSKRAILQAVAARSSKKAEEFAENHKTKTYYGSYEELAKDPNVDVIYIGVLHNSHKKLSMMALENGKHVICEKPLTVSLKETIEMYDCAKKNKRILMEAMWTRFFPAIKKARKLIKDGTIGDVLEFHADFGVKIPKTVARVWQANLAGGALFDLGVYPIATVPMIFNEQELENMKITANGSLTTEEEGGPVDRCGSVILVTNTNKQAVLSWNATVRTPECLTIAGTKGRIILESFHCPTKLKLEKEVPAPEGSGTHDRDTIETTIMEFDLPDYPKEFPPVLFPNSEGMFYEVEGFCDALDKVDGSLDVPEYTTAESIAVARIIQECRDQMKLVYPWEKESVGPPSKKQKTLSNL